MAIKMTMADGTVIEGTAEELAKLQELAGIKEQSEEPTIEYDKHAQVGDTILITDAFITGGHYKNGDKLIVKKTDEDGDVYVVEGIEGDYCIVSEEFKIIGRKETEESLVGKYVVFHDRKGTATVGKYYEITGILKHGGRTYAEYTIEVGEEGNVVYPPSESAYNYEIHDEKPADETSIKVGDYAKVIDETYCNDITEGAIVEVTQEVDYDGDYRIDLIDGSEYDFAKPEALEKVEISEADLVFIENGREPDEYRKGDIVAYDDPKWFENSGIGEVIGFSESDGNPRVKAVDFEGDVVSYFLDDEIKPVAFVESRVDVDA